MIGKGKNVPGFMTVEATLVFATALSVIVFILFCGLYQYERCILELDTYYEVQQSLYHGRAMQEDIEIEAHKACAQRVKEESFWIGLLRTADVEIRVKAEMRELQPSYVLRLNQRIKRMKDERNTEAESAVSPDSGTSGE